MTDKIRVTIFFFVTITILQQLTILSQNKLINLQSEQIELLEQFKEPVQEKAFEKTSYIKTVFAKRQINKSDLDLLARIITAEASVMSDEVQLLVGQVVLNRVADDRFPDTIRDVIYQKGQYAPVKNGSIHNEPTERALRNAKKLLSGYRACGEKVVWQAEFKQGKVYKKISEKVGNYTYKMIFCY